MSDNNPESTALRAAYEAASFLKTVGKVERIDHLVQEVPPQSLQRLSGNARQKIMEAPLDPVVRHERLEMALSILDSAKLTKTFFYLKIPGNVSDFDAIESLNYLFRDRFPSLHRDAIDYSDMPWLMKLKSVTQRNIKQPRKIPIFFIAKATRNKSFEEQLEIVDKQGLVPADPIEQLLTAMAFVCLYPGTDPFRSQLLRGSVPDTAFFNTNSHGLRTFPLSGGRCPIASMSALPAVIH